MADRAAAVRELVADLLDGFGGELEGLAEKSDERPYANSLNVKNSL
jgi:hypothetical protein